MKNTVLLLLFIILFHSNYLFTQCNYIEIFPCSLGIDKFYFNTQVLSQNNFKGWKYWNSGDWEKFDYLKDSVHIDRLKFSVVSSNCLINGLEPIIYFKFCDQKLYYMKYTIRYNSNEFQKCYNYYNYLIESAKNKLSVEIPFDCLDNEINEKVGEGIGFYKNEIEKKANKINKVNISYKFVYKLQSKNNELVKTQDIEEYNIEIEYFDLSFTKLDRRGF